MKKILLLSSVCALLMMGCPDGDAAAALAEEAKRLTDLAKEKNMAIPASVDSLIAFAEKQKGDMAYAYADEARLTLALALQKKEKESLEDSLKMAQEHLVKYRKTHESRKNVRLHSDANTNKKGAL